MPTASAFCRNVVVQIIAAYGLFFLVAAASSLLTDTVLIRKLLMSVPGAVLCLYAVKSQMWQKVEKKGRGFRICAILILLCYFAVNFIGKPTSSVPEVMELLAVVSVCVLIGISEELMFRGYLFQLCRRWSPAAAVLITSILFGLLHYPQGVVGVIITCICGLVFAIARSRGAPLWSLIALHALIDLPARLPHSVTSYYSALGLLVSVSALVFGVCYFIRPSHWVKEKSQPFGKKLA